MLVKLQKGDIDILARTCWGEARNQGFRGMAAVAWVVVNRLQRGHRRFPSSVQGVCLQKWQFSCWNADDPNCERCKTVDESSPAFAQCVMAASTVVCGQIMDPTNGADHYYATSLKSPPSWVPAMDFTVKLGDHLFFRERR